MKQKQILKLFYFFNCLFGLKKKISKGFNNLEELVDFSFEEFHQQIKPGQVREEILRLLKILEKKELNLVLEIGTSRTAGTLFLFSRIASQDAEIISIDLPGGKWGGGYDLYKVPLFKSFASNAQKIHLMRKDSHEYSSLEQVKTILKGRKLDFLFIDGDHTYKGVKNDFEMYSPLVKEGGIIAFHDINHSEDITVETGYGCGRLWKEIKDNYENIEIIEDWKDYHPITKKYIFKEVLQGIPRKGPGIGVIVKN